MPIPAGTNNVAPGTQRPQQGTGFVNVQDILNANQGNQLGDVLQAGQQSSLTNFNNQLDTAQGAFQNQTDQQAATLNNDQNDVQTVLNIYGQDPELKGTFGGSNISKPSGGGQQTDVYKPGFGGTLLNNNSDANIINGVGSAYGGKNAQQRFAAYGNAQYQGPTQLDQNTQKDLSTQASNLNQFNSLNSTDAGRQALLSQFITNPNYTQSQQALDATLAQGGQPTQTLGNKYIDYSGLLNRTNAADQGYAGSLAGGYAALKPTIQSGVQGMINDVNTLYNGTNGSGGIVNNYNQQAKQTYDTLKADMASGNLTAADLQALGLSGSEQTYGIKNQLGNFVTAQPTITENQALSEADRARLIGLSNLIGATPGVEDLTTAKANGDALNTSTYNVQNPQNGASYVYGGQPTTGAQFNADPNAVPGGLSTAPKFNSTGWNTALTNAQNQLNQQTSQPVTNQGTFDALNSIFVPNSQIAKSDNPADDPFANVLDNFTGSNANEQQGGGGPGSYTPNYNPGVSGGGNVYQMPSLQTGENLSQYQNALNQYSGALNNAYKQWEDQYGGGTKAIQNIQPIQNPNGPKGDMIPNPNYVNLSAEAPNINALFAARQSEVQQAQQAYQAQLAALQAMYGGGETLGQKGFTPTQG